MIERRDWEAYLKQAGFARLWQKAREKYERYGGITGTVTLPELDDTEREALEGLLMKNFTNTRELKLSLSQLDAALRQTRYNRGLEDALRTLFPQLSTRRDRRLASEASWERFCAWAESFLTDNELLLTWFFALKAGGKGMSRLLRQCHELFVQHGTCPDWLHAVTALKQLPARGERLPVFAARTTGDPHGLDRHRLSGRLFFSGVRFLFGGVHAAEVPMDDAIVDEGSDGLDDVMEMVSQSEEIRQLYEGAGIRLDEVSSTVLVAVWNGFRMETQAWTLREGHRLAIPDRMPAQVFAVENPSVFEALLDHAEGRKCPPLVCTSGQPSVAALKLLDASVAEGVQVYYSGDFDLYGIQMALALHRRHGKAFHAWRMSASDYASVTHEWLPALSEQDCRILAEMSVPWDETLTLMMSRRGRKVYQEHLLDKILEDWRQAVREV